MRTKLGFMLVALLWTGVGAAVEFDFNDGAQGWSGVSAANGMANFTASGGIIGFDYVTPTSGFDPILNSPAVSVPAARDHWLILDVNVTAAPATSAVNFQVFYSTGAGYNEPQSRTFNVTPNTGWQTVVFDMLPLQSGRTDWSGTVVQLRVDPGSSEADLVGYRCEIDRIALTDDTDDDTIADDAEIFWFTNITEADETTDHDSNGIKDAFEIAMGVNPLVDEGEKLPVSGVGLLGVLAMVLGVCGVRKTRP